MRPIIDDTLSGVPVSSNSPNAPTNDSAAVGVMALPASLVAGILWHRISPAAPFAFGAALAGLALLGLWFVPPATPSRR